MPRSIRTITTAIAIAALTAPTALAQPADIHAPLAKAASDSHKQHLRSPDKRDAAPTTTPSDRNTARPDTTASPNLTSAADRALAQQRYYTSYGKSTATGDNVTPAADRALAQERYYTSYGKSTATDDNVTPAADRALAQERYYTSYGEPEPLTRPQSPVPSDDTPWLPIALSITAGLLIVATSATQLRRLRLRRHRATRSAA